MGEKLSTFTEVFPYGPLGVTVFLLAIVVVVLAVSYGIFFALFGGRRLFKLRPEVEDVLLEFSAEVESLRHKHTVLSAYMNDYFVTFQESGWGELGMLLHDLEVTQNALDVMLEERRYADVKSIGKFLMGRLPRNEAEALITRFDGLASMSTWRSDSRMLLRRIIDASMESAKHTQTIGLTRKRSRNPTLITLAELSRTIGDS